MRARNVTRGTLLGGSILPADTFLLRLKGLIGRGGLGPGEGLWISPCRCIHSFGMRFPIDAVFVGRDGRGAGLCEGFRRGRVSRFFRAARGVLELPEGTIAGTGTRVGAAVLLEP